MNLKLTIIGLALMLVSVIILNIFPFLMPLGIILIFIGVLLFAGIYSERSFIDFITFEDGNYIISVRKRLYYNFFPFTIIFSIFRFDIDFIYTVEYYKFVTPNLEMLENNIEQIKVNRAEYKKILQNQKQQYLNNSVPKELVNERCSPQYNNIKLAKTRYIIWLILAILCLTGLTVPSDWILSIVSVALFGLLAAFRYTEYKQAQFKYSVYNNYFKNSENQ